MITIITSQQMKDLDNRTISEYGIPSRVLMETAGKGCADILRLEYDKEMQHGVTVLCGMGNNGGDGYVIARWLDYYGYAVSIISQGKAKSPETTANRELCEKLPLEIIDLDAEANADLAIDTLGQAGVIIDALYGIGFKGNLPDDMADLIRIANALDAVKIAIDMPSGVNADTGYAGLAFKADLTLTMESLKYGHVLGKGRLCSKMVEIVPIGIPDMYMDEVHSAILLEDSIAILPERKSDSHKGDYGRIAVFAGSQGFTGAAFLSSLAAIKSGAGLVSIFAHPEQCRIYDNKPYEIMVRKITLQPNGKIDTGSLQKALTDFDVVLFGPGCSVSDFSFEVLNFIVDNWHKPAVIDADGLNLLSQHKELYPILEDRPFILTPHWGEFCRLADVTKEQLEQDSIGCLKQFAGKYKLKVLLKSSTSIYYDTETTYINTSGNDGLSTGGSGDVLAGLIAGFLAQKMKPADAAGMAAYYLGLTAEHLAEKQEAISIIPTDILDNIFKFELFQDTIIDE